MNFVNEKVVKIQSLYRGYRVRKLLKLSYLSFTIVSNKIDAQIKKLSPLYNYVPNRPTNYLEDQIGNVPMFRNNTSDFVSGYRLELESLIQEALWLENVIKDRIVVIQYLNI
jgi:hypothetical protein